MAQCIRTLDQDSLMPGGINLDRSLPKAPVSRPMKALVILHINTIRSPHSMSLPKSLDTVYISMTTDYPGQNTRKEKAGVIAAKL